MNFFNFCKTESKVFVSFINFAVPFDRHSTHLCQFGKVQLNVDRIRKLVKTVAHSALLLLLLTDDVNFSESLKGHLHGSHACYSCGSPLDTVDNPL